MNFSTDELEKVLEIFDREHRIRIDENLDGPYLVCILCPATKATWWLDHLPYFIRKLEALNLEAGGIPHGNSSGGWDTRLK